MNIFVTVGTTCFDELVTEITKEKFVKNLVSLGYSSMNIQYGRGKKPKSVKKVETFSLSFFDLKPSIQEDMKNSDLIICHCGAGSILESLRCKKKVVAVINETLQDNHQLELAKVLYEKKNVIMTSCDKIYSLFTGKNFLKKLKGLEPLEAPVTDNFRKLIEEEMGL